MFITNSKYYTVYMNIVERGKKDRQLRVVEKHHVLPRSLGGTDDVKNLTFLTPKEHFICHMILPKILLLSEDRNKMISAFVLMSGRKKYTSRSYDLFREEYAIINSRERMGEKNGMYGVRRTGPDNPFYGKKHSEETKRKISETKLGVSITLPPKSDAHKKKLSDSMKKRWQTISPEKEAERARKWKESFTSRKKTTCPHCGQVGKEGGNMKRYHFDNCKFKTSFS